VGKVFVLALELTDGMYQPLAWSENKLSGKRVRRLTKKFSKERDVVCGKSVLWTRLYRTPFEAVTSLPKIGGR
jgi:hypothetical protein